MIKPRTASQHETRLTALARAHYEESAMLVRETAAVTELTIKKYAAKQHRKLRYRFAREKGAGGRFIRREDQGSAFAQGLKAPIRMAALVPRLPAERSSI
jgi:hypothetical protein